MKNFKRFVMCMSVLLVLSGCANKNKEPPGASIKPGIYYKENVDIAFAPRLELQENSYALFSYSAVSGHLPMGPYEVENGKVILTEDILYENEDTYRKYVFEINGDTLVFLKSESSPIPDFGILEKARTAQEGDVFACSQETLTDNVKK